VGDNADVTNLVYHRILDFVILDFGFGC
jgi:hypothetical protein